MLSLLTTASCTPAPTAVKPQVQTGAPVRVRSFSDSLPVNCLAAAGGILWAGTPHGLVRWTMAKDRPTAVIMTTVDGLPADKITAMAIDDKGGVWAVTPKGLSRFADGGWTNYPAPPVGDLIAGIVAMGDGDTTWVGGSDGIARLRSGEWQKYAAGTTVTALSGDGQGGLWVGTSGKGVMRILKDEVVQFGMTEGNDIDNVRGMAAGQGGAVLVVGDSPGGPRAAYYDGTRFYSYRVESPGVLEWVRRAGSELLLGGGQQVWSMKRIADNVKPVGAVRFTFVGAPTAMAAKALPLKSLLPKEEEAATKDAAAPGPKQIPAATKPTPVGGQNDELLQDDAGKKGQKGKKPKKGKAGGGGAGQALLDGPQDRPWLVAGPGGQAVGAPRFDAEPVKVRLPDGVTSVTSDADALYVGTRFLGVSRIEKGQQAQYRLFDLSAGAERLTVACVSNDECYVATGGNRAWRFDGQSFEVTEVDPEKGSHVLAVVRDPNGAVIALHRGATNKQVRISRVGTQGKWVPVGVTSLEVPSGGVPDISFATYSPRGRLWVGLRYTDKEQDVRDFGAAEVGVDDGKVVYHRQKPKGASQTAAEGVAIPSDVTAIAFRGQDDIWLASRSGAVLLTGGKVRVFTENDGLESELLHDVVEGLGGQLWVATSKGIGMYDGSKWSFPKTGYYNLKAQALARDPEGRIWIGSDHGVMEVLDQDKRHFIGTRTGLLDDHVLNLAVDIRGRIWTLTQKGISVIDPL